MKYLNKVIVQLVWGNFSAKEIWEMQMAHTYKFGHKNGAFRGGQKLCRDTHVIVQDVPQVQWGLQPPCSSAEDGSRKYLQATYYVC